VSLRAASRLAPLRQATPNVRSSHVRIARPQPRQRPYPSPETQRLGALVGQWRSEGHIVGDPPVPITGTDSYEWLPGGFFLVHHVDVKIGKQPVQALELIGPYDPATDSYTARAYDNLGNITLMQAKVDEQGVWTFTGGDVAAVARPAAAEGAERCGPR
jgi:hypothetical protein